MAEKMILTVKCPSCGTTLQIKTRSAEKTIACPKCLATTTVNAGPAAAQADLPFATTFDEPQPSLPMAEPMAAGAPMLFAEPLLPSATPLASAPRLRLSPFLPIAIASCAVCALVTVALVLAFKSGPTSPDPKVATTDKPSTDKPSTDKSATDKPQQPIENPVVPADDGGFNKDQSGKVAKKKSAPPQEVGSAAKQAAKAQLDFANQAYLAADSAWQQRRNWRLANEGRLRASGIKLVDVQQEPTKIAVDQAWAAFQLANRVYQQSK